MTNKQIIKNFFIECYEKHNYKYAEKYLASNYYDHSPANARSNIDAINIMKLVESMVSNVKITISDMIEENNKIAVRVTFSLLHTGLWMGVQGHGEPIHFEALEIFKINNGIITESWGYWPDAQIETFLNKH